MARSVVGKPGSEVNPTLRLPALDPLACPEEETDSRTTSSYRPVKKLLLHGLYRHEPELRLWLSQ